MAKNTAAILDALLDSVGVKSTIPAPTTAPVETVKAPVKRTVKTVAPASKSETVPVVDGYTITMTDDHDTEIMKAAIIRNTDNPWYGVALVLASKKCATLRIEKNPNVKGTPLARIRAAIARGNNIRTDAMMRGVKVPAEVTYFHKLGIAAHVKDAGVWNFVKMA